ncbi:hypothetical protein P8625_03165 [Tenacibaculum tangerinum]|uniref:DUF2490 domain-containing protein n=1 Tax=Tenacibaculum tangerinum TaxID=3038772 RepID=A0ABY8L7L8_9FLAO|nr:hypothetical protein [Tenacibaculum tangerinum]WGH76183.1 hypothetical protein P8625_03165 [Tenacibaculum tangerinum]
MNKKRYTYTLLLLLLVAFSLQAQEEDAHTTVKRHQIGLLLAHTHLKHKAIELGKNRLSLPSFTLFYNYHFNEKWMLGLHTDFINEQFIVEESGEKTIERERP